MTDTCIKKKLTAFISFQSLCFAFARIFRFEDEKMGVRINCGQINNFPVKYVYGCIDYDLLAMNNIVQKAVTWKCRKGFVTYFNINNNKKVI